MKLTELQPAFIVQGDDGAFRPVQSLPEADGIMFLCPQCYRAKGSAIGVHRVICWQPGVPPHIAPGPGRWQLQGSGFDDLSLVANSSSVQLHGGCEAHFFVTGGAVSFA